MGGKMGWFSIYPLKFHWLDHFHPYMSQMKPTMSFIIITHDQNFFSRKLVKFFFSKGPPFAWKSKYYEYLFYLLVIMFSYHQFFSCVIIIKLIVGFIYHVFMAQGNNYTNQTRFIYIRLIHRKINQRQNQTNSN